jgi:hypothetical protein
MLGLPRVATPCTADWSSMTGDERVRRCGQCRKNVYNLTELTHAEAAALVFEHNGKLCLRYYQRHDGTILLADCTVGISRGNRHRWLAAGAASLVAGGLGAAVARYELREPERMQHHGSVALDPPDPPDPLARPSTTQPKLTQPPRRPARVVSVGGWVMGIPPIRDRHHGSDD